MTSTPGQAPIISRHALLAHWSRLLDGVPLHRRSLWLMAHDGEGRPARPVVIVDDLPLHPDADDVASLLTVAEHFLADGETGDRLLIMLTRPGPHRTCGFEEAWNEALAEPLAPLRDWPLCCGTPGGVVALEPPFALPATAQA